jgi:acetyl esterase/lipase
MKKFLLLLLAGFGAAAQNVEITVPDNVELQRGVLFARAGGIDLLADLYLPKGPGPFPAVVYIHGGGWSGGDRTQLRRQAAYMAGKGVAGFAVDYRLSGQAKFPAALDDVKEALRWVRANAAKYRIDPRRIAAAGSSAGGHLAAMLGVSSGTNLAAVIAFNPVLDLTAMAHRDKMVTAFLGKPYDEAPELYKQASPVAQVTKSAAPFLILHGTADQTVPYQQAVDMLRKLKQAGVEAELFTAEGGPHTFWSRKEWAEPSTKAMEAFLFRHFGKN